MPDPDTFRGLLHGAVTRSNGRVVYSLKGDVDMVTSEPLIARVRELLDDASGFDLDLSEVAFMDSTGLRTLFRLHDVAADAGGLRLVRPSDPVRRLLELTETLGQFEIVEA